MGCACEDDGAEGAVRGEGDACVFELSEEGAVDEVDFGRVGDCDYADCVTGGVSQGFGEDAWGDGFRVRVLVEG